MKGSSRALFRAVVVMGAALACDRSATPTGAPETKPVVAEPVRAEPVVAEPVKTEPVVAEPVKTEPVKTEPVVVAVPEAGGEPTKKTKAKQTKDIREKCPEGSEMLYPPCFYIL